MNTKICVRNLAGTVTERDVQNLCSPYGNVAEVNLPQERERGHARGFAIVTMATPQGAQAAILALNGKEVAERVLMVAEHIPPSKAPPAPTDSKQRSRAPSIVGQKVSASRRFFGLF
jgi:RNA recognition motif-containing protein